MRKQTFRQYGLVVVLALALSFGFGGSVNAETAQSSSNDYGVSEVHIGGNGAALNDCNDANTVCASMSLGDTVDGQASSADYRAQFGSDPTDKPLLEVIVTGGISDLGKLSPSTTATATDDIKIRSYLSSGYSLLISGAPPSQGVHNLKTMNSGCPCTSQPGAEQFGINLAANSSPNIGSDPVQVPSSAFSHGYAASNYNQHELFYYANGDTIAKSDTQTGETDYTLSMILNISTVTPGGQYTGTYAAVVVPNY